MAAKKGSATQPKAEDKKLTAISLLANKTLRAKLERIAPPKFDMARQFEFANALAVMLDNSPKPVSPRSVVGCMYTAISLGLSLNTVKGEAFLVPFAGKATFIPGYKGLIKLMRNAGLKDIQAKIVWEGDDFEHSEDADGVHYRLVTTKDKERGEPEWGISRAILADGTVSILVIPYHKIEAIKIAALARTPKSPWKDYGEEMSQKTCIRMHSKTLPMDDAVATAVHWDEKVELNDRSMELPADLAEIIGEDEPVPEQEQKQQPTEAADAPPTSTIDQKIRGIQAFITPEEVEGAYTAVEAVTKKKRDKFGDDEKALLLAELEKKLDE